MGASAVSKHTRAAGARVAGLKVTESVCPYCAVGCGQLVYTRDGELVDIEGNPRSPINQGTLCPKGSASRQLIQQPGRLTKVLYRRPHGTEWEELELERAMDMIAERVLFDTARAPMPESARRPRPGSSRSRANAAGRDCAFPALSSCRAMAGSASLDGLGQVLLRALLGARRRVAGLLLDVAGVEVPVRQADEQRRADRVADEGEEPVVQRVRPRQVGRVGEDRRRQ
ncbi:MAG TPA: hypothetical protein VMY78_06400, partial [Solirubrobacteraceae bacterium]|nr:hypothetical protein [Solirubrobacteraceae bacterium]